MRELTRDELQEVLDRMIEEEARREAERARRAARPVWVAGVDPIPPRPRQPRLQQYCWEVDPYMRLLHTVFLGAHKPAFRGLVTHELSH